MKEKIKSGFDAFFMSYYPAVIIICLNTYALSNAIQENAPNWIKVLDSFGIIIGGLMVHRLYKFRREMQAMKIMREQLIEEVHQITTKLIQQIESGEIVIPPAGLELDFDKTRVLISKIDRP